MYGPFPSARRAQALILPSAVLLEASHPCLGPLRGFAVPHCTSPPTRCRVRSHTEYDDGCSDHCLHEPILPRCPRPWMSGRNVPCAPWPSSFSCRSWCSQTSTSRLTSYTRGKG